MATHRVPTLETFGWQHPVIGAQAAPPGSPVKGDRYIINHANPSGAWTGHPYEVATYNGSGWIFAVPNIGWFCFLNASPWILYYYSENSIWEEFRPTPDLHAASHKSAGGDAIKLDELAAPTDVTTLDATTSLHGLLKKLGGGTTNFLRADGAWAMPPGAAPPTGTGFRHVTTGSEDASSKLVENADVSLGAAIAESKLALNNATHPNTNDPTADQKAALAGTSGTPSVTNKYVTNADARNTDARTPTTHVHAGSDITSGTLDGDRLAAPTTTKRGGVKATGTPSGKFLKDDDTWATPAGGDMTKAVYDTDADNIVDKAEAVDDGAGNSTTAAQVKEAYTRRAAYDADYKCLLFTI